MNKKSISQNTFYTIIWKPLFFRCSYYNWNNKIKTRENKNTLAEEIGISCERLIFANQRHTDKVKIVTKDNYMEEVEADAMITKEAGIALATLTADCIPIIFSDLETWAIGSIHAGSQGLKNLIIQNTFDALKFEFWSSLKQVQIFIGPAISQKFYEVWKEFLEFFDNKYLLSWKPGKYFLDIKTIAKHQCIELWIQKKNIQISDICTYEDQDNFHSYRRKTHKDYPNYGNNACVIWKEKT